MGSIQHARRVVHLVEPRLPASGDDGRLLPRLRRGRPARARRRRQDVNVPDADANVHVQHGPRAGWLSRVHTELDGAPLLLPRQAVVHDLRARLHVQRRRPRRHRYHTNRGDTVRGYTCVVSSKPPPSPPPQGLQPPPPQPSPPPPTPPPNPSCAFESAEARKKYALELAALADEDGSGGLWPGEFRTLLCGRDGTSRDRGESETASTETRRSGLRIRLAARSSARSSGSHWRSHQPEAIALHDVRGTNSCSTR